MLFLEALTGETNRFDKGFALNSSDTKALRDSVVYLLDRVKRLEERLSPANKEVLETVKETSKETVIESPTLHVKQPKAKK